MPNQAAATDGQQPLLPPAIAFQNVGSTYEGAGTRLTALAGCSFAVQAEEFLALIGPSGSGKSTLLDIAAGLLEPDEGSVELAGVKTTAGERIGRVAYMHQRDLLLPWRTVIQNGALGLEAQGKSAKAAADLVRERLVQFGLTGRGGAYPAELSGGMRQRVALLRTILPRQPLLLLDEPFGALDALTRSELHNWLLDLWTVERSAVLLVTHDVEEAVFLADRVVVLSDRPGRVLHIENITLSRPRMRLQLTSPASIAHKSAILVALGMIPSGAP